MLHPITRRFRDPDTERRYREAFIDTDRLQATVTAGVLLMPMLGFAIADLVFFSGTGVPLQLSLARVGMVALTVALIARLRWPVTPAGFDRLIGGWWLLVGLFILFVNSTRPPGYLLHNVLDSAVSLITFVTPVIAIGLQTLPPLMLACVNVLEAWQVRDQVGTTPLIVLPITYTMVLLIGYTTAWRLHGLRREQWVAMQQQLALQRQLEELANTDALTGVLNRRQFLALAETEFARAARNRRPLAALVLDIDHFKRINDTWGHETGDEALVAVARALGAELRKQDLLARLGGEEFAVLLPETAPLQAAQVAERLRVACAELAWHPVDATARLTASIGVASIEVDDTDIAALFRRADGALYEAKHAGRNRVIAR